MSSRTTAMRNAADEALATLVPRLTNDLNNVLGVNAVSELGLEPPSISEQ